MKRPLFIGSEIYRNSIYGPRHPLSIPRVPTTIDLCRALGWLPDEAYLESGPASVEELARFHDRDYIAVLQQAEREQRVSPDIARRYNLGKIENPIYPAMFRRPATACGATLLAVDLIAGGGIVYSPAGGTHHGRPDRASGFCYFNDPVLGILRLLELGLQRILYLDVDAHHGDGVEAAFAFDARVLTVSIHEAGRWPFTGRAEDRAGGSARNLPVPPGCNDSEFDLLLGEAVLPLAWDFAPEAIVLQCGADALEEDPLSRLSLSNGALWRVVAAVRELAPRLLVLGGGGYNPWSVARCWSGVWATLNRLPIPEQLPPTAEAVLRRLSWNRSAGRNPPQHWFTTLADAPRPGPVREEVRRVARLALEREVA
ncbi:MAG: acetoin utilization protein AcuC [Alphaproteobacteria bacterium]|nr:acetoin utilization protein AcuC [Alphaproteobacteria bacterium]